MSPIKLVAVLLLLAGVLGLAYGRFTYTTQTHEAQIGSLELSVNDRETVNIPVWLGVGALVLGGILLVVPMKSNA